MSESTLHRLSTALSRVAETVGNTAAWLALGLVLVTFAVVVLRYLFQLGWIAMQDVRELLHLRVPERGIHEGLAGLTQAFGLILFSWMALSGAGLFLLATAKAKRRPGGEPGRHAVGNEGMPAERPDVLARQTLGAPPCRDDGEDRPRSPHHAVQPPSTTRLAPFT